MSEFYLNVRSREADPKKTKYVDRLRVSVDHM